MHFSMRFIRIFFAAMSNSYKIYWFYCICNNYLMVCSGNTYCYVTDRCSRGSSLLNDTFDDVFSSCLSYFDSASCSSILHCKAASVLLFSRPFSPLLRARSELEDGVDSIKTLSSLGLR